MPAARQRSRSPFMALAVMAIMGMRAAGVPLANFAASLEAVHLRHLAIHEDQPV